MLRWPDLLPHRLEVAVSLGPLLELRSLGVALLAPAGAATTAGLEPTTASVEAPAAAELRRAIARCAAGAGDVSAVEARLQRLTGIWRRSRGNVPLLWPPRGPADTRARPGPRLFVDAVASNAANVSWEPLGGVGEEAVAFEVEALHRPQGRSSGSRAELESLGCFLAPGDSAARRYVFRCLRPMHWHYVRVRALGPSRAWTSAWSNEVPLKTLSVEAARAAGRRMTPDGFFEPSERRICSAVQGGDVVAGADAGLLPAAAEAAHLRTPLVHEELNEVFGALGYVAVKDLLDARYCKGGWSDFVKLGKSYSRPPAESEQRRRRMRLVIAARELYDPSYVEGNPWSMGPFYYEETGRQIMEAAAARGGA